MKTNRVVTIVSIIVIALIVWAVLTSRQSGKESATNVTLEGEIACLPPKSGQEIVVLLCGVGLKTADGTYYSLDTSQLDNPIITYASGTRVKISGQLTAVAADEQAQFESSGALVVTDVTPL